MDPSVIFVFDRGSSANYQKTAWPTVTNARVDNPLTDAIIDSMAQLIVRNLDEDIVDRLRQRAAKHRRSTEAEHREILREALGSPRGRRSLKEHLLTMPDVGTDKDFERQRDRPRRRVRL